MPLRAIALAAVAIMLASAGVSATAQAQTRHERAAASAKSKPAKKLAQPPAAAVRIACPIGGCRPIPANCTTTMGQTWTAATGYEIIHCP